MSVRYVALLAGVSVLGSLVYAAPPASVPKRSPEVQRALDSRGALLNRPNVGVGGGSAPTGGAVGSGAAGNAAIQGQPAPPAGLERLGTEASRSGARRLSGTAERQTGNRGQTVVGKAPGDRRQSSKGETKRRDGEQANPRRQDAGAGSVPSPVNVALSKQLAALDRMRDAALKSGDLEALDRIDAIEKKLRADFDSRQISAESRSRGRDFGQSVATEAQQKSRDVRRDNQADSDRQPTPVVSTDSGDE